MKTSVVVGISILSILLAFGGLFYYSYTQIHVSLNDIKYHSIDWTDFSISTLFNLGLNALSGNWLQAAFDLIEGVNLNLIFGLSNKGLLPVYIPDISYDLFVNKVRIGQGTIPIDVTLYPGDMKQVTSLQNIKKSSMIPTLASIIDNDGMLDIRVKGTGYFKILGFSIPVPFETSKQISLYDEIKKRLTNETARYQKNPTSITLNVPKYSIYEGDTQYISGKLTTNGIPLHNAVIDIKDEDTGSGDDEIMKLYTDNNGNFGFTWTAKSMDPLDNVVELYAVFEGTSTYDSARSYQYDISVLSKSQPIPEPPIRGTPLVKPIVPSITENTFKSTSISLSIPYSSVNQGDIVPISGKLIDSSGKGVSNAIIYIKDEDTGSGDDEIFTTRTDSNGSYNVNWIARGMDPFDNVVEIYAVFEGSSNYGHARSVQINVRVN